MNAQNFGEPTNPSDNDNWTRRDASAPELNSDPLSADPVDKKIVPETPASESVSHAAPANESAPSPAALFSQEESGQLRTRWSEIQGNFVDEPRVAVEQADKLVSEVIQKMVRIFSSEHNSLESQWKEGTNVSTEDLRKALQNYRAFF